MVLSNSRVNLLMMTQWFEKRIDHTEEVKEYLTKMLENCNTAVTKRN